MIITGIVSRIFLNQDQNRVYLQLVGDKTPYDFCVENVRHREIGLTQPGDDVVIDSHEPQWPESYVRSWTNKTLNAEVDD